MDQLCFTSSLAEVGVGPALNSATIGLFASRVSLISCLLAVLVLSLLKNSEIV